jgi:hypothetical protein
MLKNIKLIKTDVIVFIFSNPKGKIMIFAPDNGIKAKEITKRPIIMSSDPPTR